jgi:hypothetical protein
VVGVTGLIVGGGIGGIFGALKEGFLEFHPFAGPGGMPLTPASCAREAVARTDVNAIASTTPPLIRLPTKSDLCCSFSRSPIGLLPSLSMILRPQLSQQF